MDGTLASSASAQGTLLSRPFVSYCPQSQGHMLIVTCITEHI